MTIANLQPIELVLKGTTERIDLLLTDSDGNAVDATELSLKVYDFGETLLFQDDFFNGYGTTPTPPTQIVKPTSTTGQYYFPFGDTSFDTANDTGTPGTYIFVWSVVGSVGTEQVTVPQVVRVTSLRTYSLVPQLRLIVDKAVKDVDDDPNDPLFLGYTDSMLIQFLKDGLSWINAFQPAVGWDTVDAFPIDRHGRLLLDAAAFAALTSQEIFAVDTDIDPYSDQGNTFSIQHQPKLAGILNSLWARMTQTIPLMKRQYVRSGMLGIQLSPNSRLNSMIQAAPTGSLFRNFFTA